MQGVIIQYYIIYFVSQKVLAWAIGSPFKLAPVPFQTVPILSETFSHFLASLCEGMQLHLPLELFTG